MKVVSEGFNRQIYRAFPIRGKDKICLVVSLKIYESEEQKIVAENGVSIMTCWKEQLMDV